MMNEFIPVFNHIKNNDNIQGVVIISTKPGSFIAGADINMLESAKSRDVLFQMSRHGQEIMNEIEQSSKLILAAVAGSCLGGGFELALACHYRIAMNDKRTSFGVPEVKLGLLPGAGGTQRLLEKLLLPDALDLLLTGKEIKAKKAKSMGLIDMLVESDADHLEDFRSIAIQKAKELVVKKPAKQSVGFLENIKSKLILNSYIRNYILSQARTKVLAQTEGLYPAPLRILDVIKQTLENGSNAGFLAEAEGFADLGMTNESKALIHLFHGRTECKKNKHGKVEKDIKTIAIIDSDIIGAGIAHVSIDKDLNVLLYNRTLNGLSRGRLQIEKGYENSLKRNRITKNEYNQILSNLKTQTTFENFNQCDMIIEASYEDLKLKQNILNELEQTIPQDCIYASNTSILPIHQIAQYSQRPDRVIGMHYFSPVEKVELLEIIRSNQTSAQTLCSAVQLGLKQGKLIIVVNDSPGFYTTRLLIFLTVEIFLLLQEGVTPKDIDRATKKFGYHIGLATLIDEYGIDLIVHITMHLYEVYGERLTDLSVIELMKKFIRNQFFGRKSGYGLYSYQTNGRKEINSKLQELIGHSPKATKDILTMEDIQWRITLRILNEATRCLEENVLNSPVDGDIGAVFGFGFPPMKGGPFHFLDTYGISSIVNLMTNYQSKYGKRFAPCQLLIDMTKENKKFYT